MDNITHSLTGLALARAGLNKYCPRATLLLILSANAPDIDILATAGGPFRYFEFHRGYTHSTIWLPFMALLTVLVAAALLREKLEWRKAFQLCCLGVASHLLIDSTNSYGIRLLLPFSSRWFHLDLNSLYDIWIMAVLAVAALWPSFANLVSREVGERRISTNKPGRGVAIFALAFFFLYDCGRAVLHHRAVAQLNARLYDDAAPLGSAAFPEPFSPFVWRGVVETGRSFELIPLDALQNLDLSRAQVFYKPAISQSFKSAMQTTVFRYFLYFARFPVWSEYPAEADGGLGVRVEVTDLRFGTPPVPRFRCVALEDNQNRVLRSWFAF